MKKIIILGSGVAGLSSAFHLRNHNIKYAVYEKNSFYGGHVSNEQYDGFLFDDGPHVSFTKNKYVSDLFFESVGGQFLEQEIKVCNYWFGKWIDHPAQSNLYAVDSKIRIKLFKDFIKNKKKQKSIIPNNYAEWLQYAFGKKFYTEFPQKYTEKYWTINPEYLSTDWAGERVFNPSIEDVAFGLFSPPIRKTHYITSARYPVEGGYISFAKGLVANANIQFKKELSNISFKTKTILFNDNTSLIYDKMISTIPISELIFKSDAPLSIKNYASDLLCTQLLLINI